jgi:hypothetical protein
MMPLRLAETLGLTATIRAIPIVEPEAVYTIGLVVPARADDAAQWRPGGDGAAGHATRTA